MTAFELRLSERQKTLALLYLARQVDARTLMRGLAGCELMSLLRLPEAIP